MIDELESGLIDGIIVITDEPHYAPMLKYGVMITINEDYDVECICGKTIPNGDFHMIPFNQVRRITTKQF